VAVDDVRFPGNNNVTQSRKARQVSQGTEIAAHWQDCDLDARGTERLHILCSLLGTAQGNHYVLAETLSRQPQRNIH
jgi:hypothetical protein